MAKYKITVSDECIGCQACISVAEDLFEIDEKTNRSKPKKKVIEEKELKKAKEAEEICPVNAIKVTKI